jgi:predicted Ser/Thr protein kinase
MDAERWKRVEDLLQAALQVPAEQQEEFLCQACAGDASLLEEVRSLLTSDRKAGSFLEHPAINLQGLAFTRCQVCRAQNVEPAERCHRCGAALKASPTMSISSEVAEGGPAANTPFAGPSQARGFTPGSMVGDRYRVVSLLGRGGMGEVYGADDLKLGQRVALKFLPIQHGKNQSWREQFYAEVRMARQVSHPNVCRVYDVGESDGRLFLSMEFVDGEDLASLLRRIGRLPDDKAVEIAQQLCSGLAAAHRGGVLHRDLKPSNVMIDGKGRARITDFGLAIVAEEADSKSGPAGTPGYLAPELFAGAAPSVQSDLYALGLVLYELFTGKKAFEASSLAEFYRKQTETNPTPPSTVVKNFDPAIERAILRCLDRDPAQRPRSALNVSASLPGGDPLSAAMAAGETPSPEMVAAAGPEGALRPAVAWAYLAGTVVLIIAASVFLGPYNSDWGLVRMNKSPEVLADRAQELAQKLGYPAAVDRAFWVGSEPDFLDYATRNPSGKDWKRASREQAWPSPVSFWYRQSPQWMTPSGLGAKRFPSVTTADPPFETSGMLAIKLDMQGKLLFLRAVPPQVGTGGPRREPDWNLLFAEAGLDKAQFVSASPKWTPPDAFDSLDDWEGHLAAQPDLPLHVTAAAYYGIPVYFQVIAPWDQPWRTTPTSSKIGGEIASMVALLSVVGYAVVGGFFARRNIRRGRGDAKGALRLVGAAALLNCALGLLTYHMVPRADYIGTQFIILGLPLFVALLAWIGYMAVEPYARRTWPKLMVSWQRLLNGRFRDPLVGRDVLLGLFAGSLVGAVFNVACAFVGISAVSPVDASFGQGVLPSIGLGVAAPSLSCLTALLYLAILSIATGLLRRRWLGLAATGLILLVVTLNGTKALDYILAVCFVLVFLIVLTRVGLVAAASFSLMYVTLAISPPLDFTQWYAGRAVIALLIPLALLVYGFYVSLGGQPMLGSALREEE